MHSDLSSSAAVGGAATGGFNNRYKLIAASLSFLSFSLSFSLSFNSFFLCLHRIL
jgi:hypothetical protein